jgi:amidohydrolase
MTTALVDQLKQAALAEIDAIADRLVHVSREIHAHPELNYEEHFAHDLLADVLDDRGLAPVRGAYDVATAFEARVGDSGPEVAVLLEYDALPGIGHACGHNVIAAAGLGAGLAAAVLAREAGGRLRIMGTPAEEGGGGKVLMARQGAFDGLIAAMMVHPADADLLRMDAIAVQAVLVDYEGKAAHAAAAPWEGRNALDAAVLGYMNVAALRQHIRPTERVHGVITQGGEKANIVPRQSQAHWMVRSDTIETLLPLRERVVACLEGAAQACGCTMRTTWDGHRYADMRDSGPIAAAYVRNAATVGRTVVDPATLGHRVVGSTDMGNVSYLTPSIHPMIQVAPRGVAIHTADFAAYAGADEGDRAVLDGARAMALTVIDLWCDDALREAAHQEFSTITGADEVLS